ncbi:PadR family transcriptional regulator [Haloglycomyces albus]|uniref:PadR family transcriptional regulator n=1 Tax=Haloglycomyces albus TaxID=526067 RepID=UPI00046C8EA6|nr:PadR family transcriptional regulator [Haloglycomyces albus]
MSIKYSLLALLKAKPAYGYELRASFEYTTGSTWPLNIGQVYTTLARLERDGLVNSLPENEAGQRLYEITEAGLSSLEAWFTAPVKSIDNTRDELAIKIALAVTTPGVDTTAVLQKQRMATLRTLQEYTRLKNATHSDDLAWILVLESMIYRAEAEIRWIDHTEAVIERTPQHSLSPVEPRGLPSQQAERKADKAQSG